jgi:hypothetical protein
MPAVADAVCIFHLSFSIHFPIEGPPKTLKKPPFPAFLKLTANLAKVQA